MPLRFRIASILAAIVLALATGMAAAQGTAGAPPARLAVVDMDRVMAESRMGQAEQAAIDRLRAQRTAIINDKQKELEEREEQIRSASLSWSAEKREERMREYETKRIELRRLNEDATRDVQAEFNRSLAKLQRAALEVTGAIGLEQGYTLIFEKRSLPVLYASESIDVTTEVVRRLDAAAGSAGSSSDPSSGGGR
jgi:Skp family chaperone for outer membrane proteins